MHRCDRSPAQLMAISQTFFRHTRCEQRNPHPCPLQNPIRLRVRQILAKTRKVLKVFIGISPSSTAGFKILHDESSAKYELSNLSHEQIYLRKHIIQEV